MSRTSQTMSNEVITPAVAAVGAGMAAAPAFYETKAWSATVAILGMILLVGAVVRYLLWGAKWTAKAWKAFRWDGKTERRAKPDDTLHGP